MNPTALPTAASSTVVTDVLHGIEVEEPGALFPEEEFRPHMTSKSKPKRRRCCRGISERFH